MNLKRIIHRSKYKISIVPLAIIKRDLKSNPKLKLNLSQAKTILNKKLLFDLRQNL